MIRLHGFSPNDFAPEGYDPVSADIRAAIAKATGSQP